MAAARPRRYDAAVRHQRNVKQKRVAAWPAGAATPEETADSASYIGSSEHKDHISPAGPPKLRHNDATPCDPRYADFARPTAALRESIRARRTSDFVGRFPKYVWGRLDEEWYEARLVNHELGQYKAYRIDATELPEDPAEVLAQHD